MVIEANARQRDTLLHIFYDTHPKAGGLRAFLHVANILINKCQRGHFLL